MKEIAFSKLTLDLKKQFIAFLAKHDIDFKRLKDSRFLETKIKLIGHNGRPTKVILTPNDISHLARKTQRVNKYHIKCCAQEAWSHRKNPKSPCKSGRAKSTKRKRRSKEIQKLIPSPVKLMKSTKK
jgi:hypothetical protein